MCQDTVYRSSEVVTVHMHFCCWFFGKFSMLLLIEVKMY